MSEVTTNRREFIAGSGALMVALTHLRARAAIGAGAGSAVDKLLADLAEELLADYPENATMLSIDTDPRAALKARLTDRSAAGQETITRRVASRIERLRAIDVSTLDDAARIDLDVVLTAHETAAEGFQFPYGDVALLNQAWSWRNVPYVGGSAGAAIAISGG